MSNDPRWRLAANTSDTPVIVDDAGHALGGHEYGAADTQSQAVKDAAARRVLVFPDPPPRNARTPAAAALREVERRNRDEDNAESTDGQEAPA